MTNRLPKKLTCRNIQESDLDMIMEWRMLPEITKYSKTDPDLNIDKQKAWFQKIKKSKNDYYKIVMYGGEPIGMFQITNIERDTGICYGGIYLVKYTGQGLSIHIMCNSLDFIFDKLNLNERRATVINENIASIKMFKRCGFEVTKNISNYTSKNGITYDATQLTITKEIWLNKRNSINYGIMEFIE